MTRITRRTFLSGMAASGVMLTAACGSDGSGAGSKNLTFLNEETDPPTLKMLKSATAKYQKETGISVSLSGNTIGDMRQLLSSVQAGKAFDLSTSGRPALTYLGPKLLQEMDPVMDAVGGKDNFMPSAILDQDGHFYGFPYNINNVGIYYRSDHLHTVGEEVPRTWDELKTLLRKLKSAALPGITQPISAKPATSDVGGEVLWSNHVELFDKDGNVILDDKSMKERCIDCLDFLREIKPYFVKGMESVDYGDIVKSFLTGTSTIAPYSGRVVDTIDRDAPELSKKFTFGAFPTPERGMTPSCGYDINYWLIPKRAESAAESLEFLKWFVKNEFVDYLLTGAFNMQPPLKSIYDDPKWSGAAAFKPHPEVRSTLEKMARGDGYRAGGLWLQPPVDGVLKQKIISENVIPQMYQAVLIGGKSSASAVDAAAGTLRSIAKA